MDNHHYVNSRKHERIVIRFLKRFLVSNLVCIVFPVMPFDYVNQYLSVCSNFTMKFASCPYYFLIVSLHNIPTTLFNSQFSILKPIYKLLPASCEEECGVEEVEMKKGEE